MCFIGQVLLSLVARMLAMSVHERGKMKCTFADCTGEYEDRDIVHTVRQGNRIIVIDHVPAEVCTVCGDVLFTPETVRHIEFLRQTTMSPIRTVPLYDFSQAKSACERVRE